MAPTAGPPYVLDSRNASRLADPARRAALLAHVAAAVEDRTGSKPEIRETSCAAGRWALAREDVTDARPAHRDSLSGSLTVKMGRCHH